MARMAPPKSTGTEKDKSQEEIFRYHLTSAGVNPATIQRYVEMLSLLAETQHPDVSDDHVMECCSRFFDDWPYPKQMVISRMSKMRKILETYARMRDEEDRERALMDVDGKGDIPL